MDNENMGRFIADQRKAKGMTQLDLANIMKKQKK